MRYPARWFAVATGALWLLLAGCVWAGAGETFPRLMGVNISNKNYGDPVYQGNLAKYDVVILGAYPGLRSHGQTIGEAVRAIKSRRPGILIGQYTSLDEAYDNLDRNKAEQDIYWKLHGEKWWLRNAAGSMVQWTKEFNSWLVNVSDWSAPDSHGRRYPEWLAERNYSMYFRTVPEFSVWYVDNVNHRPRVVADWNLDGRDDSPSSNEIASALRRAHSKYVQSIRRLDSSLFVIGNVDNDLAFPEFKGLLNGALMEAVIGRSWSIEQKAGWLAAMERYRLIMENTLDPHLVGFNVQGRPDDYRLMRYGLTSCLLDDGYFSYTNDDGSYGNVYWFDEYDVRLGRAIDPPQRRPWRNGIFRRQFENGIVLVNPAPQRLRVAIEPGFRRVRGSQDPAFNDGMPVTEIGLDPRDGIILVRADVAAEENPRSRVIDESGFQYRPIRSDGTSRP